VRRLRLALAQMNSTVGDLSGNTRRIIALIEDARQQGADLVAFPELAVTGYPPEDLLLKPSFLRENQECLAEIIAASHGITAVIGYVDAQADIYNAAAIIHDGLLAAVHHKVYLPNYGVFDENRYFRAGETCPVVDLNGTLIGVNICEDIWYPAGPIAAQAFADAEVIVNINASPFHAGKGEDRRRMLWTRAYDNLAVVAYVNMVGGQDELVFDGHSMVFDQNGTLLAEGSQFREELLLVDIEVESVFRQRLHDPRRRQGLEHWMRGIETVEKTMLTPIVRDGELPPIARPPAQLFSPIGEVYEALVLGVRDYAHKNGFRSVIVGLSGGIDSTLTAVIAADAIGAERVVGVSMPSRYSSDHSKTDAEELAERLGITYLTVPIEEAFTASLSMLGEAMAGTQPGLAEENLQARIRGNILMTLSNKFGHLVLSTGNKSEMACGYGTLYGDMAGGLAVIKDVLKTRVYELCRYRNEQAGEQIISESVLTKPPSAELRPDQKDTDSLPDYDVLDPILELYVEDDQSFEEIVDLGYPAEVVKKVIALVDRAEYKRRQAAPGIKVSTRAFGRDRRLPITNQFREY
jgi:NAD+ synthase (glutamine-hydrolysing)